MKAMKVLAVSVSREKGVKKENVPSIRLIAGHGVEGDAHAGDWHRQVSLLAVESIEVMRSLGLAAEFGDFAENITTGGVDLTALPLGARLQAGPEAVLELTQIGKECHRGCAIMAQVGRCIMPTDGAFFKVIVGGTVKPGDDIRIV